MSDLPIEVQTIVASVEGEMGFEIAYVAHQLRELGGWDVGGVREDELEAFAWFEGREQVSVEEANSPNCSEVERVVARDFDGRQTDVDAGYLPSRALFGDRDSDATASGAKIQHASG